MKPSKAFTRWEIVTILVIAAILCLLLVPDVQQAVNSSRRENFRNQMKAVGLALHQYQNEYGCLPPAVLKNEEGTPIHSWRALLLPQMESYFKNQDQPLNYRFNEPWNSHHNQMIGSSNLDLYRGEWPLKDGSDLKTKIVAIVDDSSYWPPSKDCHQLPRDNRTQKRIVLMAIPSSGGLWNEPIDASLDALHTLIERKAFAPFGTYVLFDNGELTWLSPDDITIPNLQKLLTTRESN